MNGFRLEIITPDSQFFDGTVEAIVFSNDNGSLQILCGHHPMISTVNEGQMRFKTENGWQIVYMTGGFAEVRPDETVIFTNFCDYNTDVASAREHIKRVNDEEIKLHRKSVVQQKRNRIAITRALEDIRRGKTKSKNI